MTDRTQPEALRLAEMLTADEWPGSVTLVSYARECVAELRRQHTRIAELEQEVAHADSLLGKANALARIRAHRIVELEAQLEAIGAGGVQALSAAPAAAFEAADAMADIQYLDGVSAGWYAANADNPNEALRKLHESRAG